MPGACRPKVEVHDTTTASTAHGTQRSVPRTVAHAKTAHPSCPRSADAILASSLVRLSRCSVDAGWWWILGRHDEVFAARAPVLNRIHGRHVNTLWWGRCTVAFRGNRSRRSRVREHCVRRECRRLRRLSACPGHRRDEESEHSQSGRSPGHYLASTGERTAVNAYLSRGWSRYQAWGPAPGRRPLLEDGYRGRSDSPSVLAAPMHASTASARTCSGRSAKEDVLAVASHEIVEEAALVFRHRFGIDPPALRRVELASLLLAHLRSGPAPEKLAQLRQVVRHRGENVPRASPRVMPAGSSASSRTGVLPERGDDLRALDARVLGRDLASWPSEVPWRAAGAQFLRVRRTRPEVA